MILLRPATGGSHSTSLRTQDFGEEASPVAQRCLAFGYFWWARRESNPQSVRNTILSRARIPIPPLAPQKYPNFAQAKCLLIPFAAAAHLFFNERSLLYTNFTTRPEVVTISITHSHQRCIVLYYTVKREWAVACWRIYQYEYKSAFSRQSSPPRDSG